MIECWQHAVAAWARVSNILNKEFPRLVKTLRAAKYEIVRTCEFFADVLVDSMYFVRSVGIEFIECVAPDALAGHAELFVVAVIGALLYHLVRHMIWPVVRGFVRPTVRFLVALVMNTNSIAISPHDHALLLHICDPNPLSLNQTLKLLSILVLLPFIVSQSILRLLNVAIIVLCVPFWFPGELGKTATALGGTVVAHVVLGLRRARSRIWRPRQRRSQELPGSAELGLGRRHVEAEKTRTHQSNHCSGTGSNDADAFDSSVSLPPVPLKAKPEHPWFHGKGRDEVRGAKPLREVNLEALRELGDPPTKPPHDDMSSGPTTPKTATSSTSPDSGRHMPSRPKLAFSAELLNRGTTAKHPPHNNNTRVEPLSSTPRLSFTAELLKVSSKKRSRPKLRSASSPGVMAGNCKKEHGGGGSMMNELQKRMETIRHASASRLEDSTWSDSEDDGEFD